ncbi:MAG TPA: hypothetical protein VK302_12180 [Terriglobales bacterium]|nr:hypothetical protein [Terriglobales bacterium]
MQEMLESGSGWMIVHKETIQKTGFGEMSQLNVSIGADLREEDFWPASLRARPQA